MAGGATAAYGAIIEPGFRLRVQRYAVMPPRWTPGLRLRIAALADFHAGEGYMTRQRIETIVDATNALDPDLIVLLGDYQTGTYLRPGNIPAHDIARMLARLKAPLGTHATLAQITDKAPILMLTHEPDIFPRLPNNVSLTLSGHTHGGQVRLFGYSPIVPSDYGNRYAYGHVVEDGRHLIVSGGLGTGQVRVRFGVPPEIVVVEVGDRNTGAATLPRPHLS